MSKKAQCMEIAMAHPEAERKTLINMFLEQVPGITPGGASTYASQVRQELLATAEVRANRKARENEPDEAIEQRLRERFEVIDMLAHASCLGQIRSLIISGPAGLGKSFTTEQAVREYDPDGEKSIIAKGFVRPTGLYLLLHEFRQKGCVIVMDDADSIYNDPDALNLLKGACDTTRTRRICWRAETRMVDVDGEPVPREFEFEGTIIFITNRDFDAEIQRGGKMAEHFEAMVSRSHYIECDMHTTRDYLIRIRQVVAMGMLRDQKGLDPIGEKIIIDFIEANADKLRELTLRMALKLADVYKLSHTRFESLARQSCFKGGMS